jgi:hypothetical protein
MEKAHMALWPNAWQTVLAQHAGYKIITKVRFGTSAAFCDFDTFLVSATYYLVRNCHFQKFVYF